MYESKKKRKKEKKVFYYCTRAAFFCSMMITHKCIQLSKYSTIRLQYLPENVFSA